MDVLAGRTSSTSLSVKVSAVRAEREPPADAPEPLELPTDRPRPAQADHAVALVRLELDEEFFTALKALGSRHGAHISTVLLAGWAAVLGRLSGQTDLVIGTSTGEIEAVLRGHESVTDCVVVAREDPDMSEDEAAQLVESNPVAGT